jgi:agmatinase
MGIPLDLTSSFRPGCRFAPQKIREASFNLETYLPSAGVDVFEKLLISDLGDLCLPSDLEEAGIMIEEETSKVAKEGKLPILLGGEHTLTYFTCRALKPDCVLYLDAHADLRDEWLGKRLCHATVARRLLDFLPSKCLKQVGIRSCAKEEDEFRKKCGLQWYSEIEEEVAHEICEELSGKRVYLSLDVDILDPAFAPGVSCPEPGGISTLQLLKFLRALKGIKLCGVDVVEVCPPFDNGEAAFAAAKIIYEILAHLL